MKSLLNAFWRAAAYCLHPKVIALSLLPLLIGVALALGAGWFYWEAAVAGVRANLESWALVDAGLKWIEALAGNSFRTVLAPLIVVGLAAPVIVVLSVLLVAWLMTPAIVKLVAARRFASLERKHGGGWFSGMLLALGATVLALVALIISLPLWLIPPLVLVIPPLIWGWLNYRVMSFEVLAEFASADERRQIRREHRLPLLGIGVVSGYLGAAPSLLWAVSAMTLVFAPVLIVASVWMYTLVFAFSALWFAHYALQALADLRAKSAAAMPPAGPTQPVTPGPRRTGEVTGEVIDAVTRPAEASTASLKPPEALPPSWVPPTGH